MIVLDLEWNHGYGKKPFNEIFQIGAVRIPGLGGPILNTFNAYIRPAVHKKMDRWAKAMPGARQARESQLGFPEAMEQFRQWCGGDTTCAMWGSGDLSVLDSNCQYWGLDRISMETLYDFQEAFSRAVGAKGQIALWRVVEYCGLPDVFTFHDALNDAMYTALVSGWLTAESLEKPCRDPYRLLGISPLEFPRQPRCTIGPFPTARQVMDAPEARQVPCPVCRRMCPVERWHPKDPAQHYAVFDCPEHGRFICRLQLRQLESGLWRGRRTVQSTTVQPVWECARAMGLVPYRTGRRRRGGKKKTVPRK